LPDEFEEAKLAVIRASPTGSCVQLASSSGRKISSFFIANSTAVSLRENFEA
jgi:hypothetical protein